MYNICHLIHGYSGVSLPLVVDFDNARKIYLQDVGEAFELGFNVHFGQCALLKKVFSEVHWPENFCTIEIDLMTSLS